MDSHYNSSPSTPHLTSPILRPASDFRIPTLDFLHIHDPNQLTFVVAHQSSRSHPHTQLYAPHYYTAQLQ